MPHTADIATHTDLRARHHPNCCVCGPGQGAGLGVKYVLQTDGRIVAEVDCPDEWEGYPGLVHGGVVASLVDGAMTHCLFGRAVAAVTADLHVRYRHPVQLGRSARVEADVVRSSPPLYVLEATIEQDDRRCITATGKFMQQPRRSEVGL